MVSKTTVFRRHDIGSSPGGVTFVRTLAELIDCSPDLIVECAGHQALKDSIFKVLEARIPILPASLGAFSDAEFFDAAQSTAQANHSRIIFPAGAIGGLDLLQSLSLAGDVAVSYQGIKPPSAWKGSPAEAAVDLDSINNRTVFFSGTGRDAARDFPKNANVLAALALAGAGFDSMKVDLIADPNAATNTHHYDVQSDICSYSITIKSAPNAGNVRTSGTTAYSILHEVQAFAANKER